MNNFVTTYVGRYSNKNVGDKIKTSIFTYGLCPHMQATGEETVKHIYIVCTFWY